MVAPSFAPYTSYGPRAALPCGPDELAYTPEEQFSLDCEREARRLDRLSQLVYPRCEIHRLTRELGRIRAANNEIEQHSMGART